MSLIESPHVSVCMIAYNVEEYIEKAIKSVLMQEVKFEVELVISNDNSSDNTEEVIQNLMETHPRRDWIKYYKQEKNLGMLPNYLWTFNRCKGKYLSICDSDDFWTDKGKLQKQVEFLDSNQEFVLSFHDSFQINGSGIRIKQTIEDYVKTDLDFQKLTKRVYPLPTASVVFRNDLGIEFPKEYINGTNHDTFLFILLSQFGKLHYQSDILPSAYRIHQAGTWNSRTKMERSLHSLELFEKVCKVFPNEQGFKMLVFEFRNNVFVYALKEKKYFVFLKNYIMNFLFTLFSISRFKKFWDLHLLMIKNKFIS